MPAATVRLTPVIVIEPLDGAVVPRALSDLAIENGKVLAKPVEFAQMPVDCIALVLRQLLTRQPCPSQPIEQLGVRAFWDQMGVQDRVHFVLDPRAMTDKLIPSRRQPALPLGLGVRGPDLRQIPGRKQARQRARVDLVGLHPRMRDRLHLQGIGDHHPPHEKRENSRHRHAIPGRLDHDLVSWKQLTTQPFERRPGHVDPAKAPQAAKLPNHHLAEGSVDVDPNHSSHLS